MSARVFIQQQRYDGSWRVHCRPERKHGHLSRTYRTQSAAHSYGLWLWKTHGWPVWMLPTITGPAEVVDLAAERARRMARDAWNCGVTEWSA